VHGGEPFLYFDVLKQILRKAAELEIPKIGVITNAYWAINHSKTKQMLSELIDAGLNRITVSVDAFHHEYIPFEKVRNAIEVAANLGFNKIWVDSYFISPKQFHTSYDLKTYSSVESLSHIQGVEFSSYQADLEGRAADLLVGEVQLSDTTPCGKCKFPFWLGGDLKEPEVIEIDREGNVTLCPGLCIGNANETSLLDILDTYDYRKHPIIHVIAENGPIGLVKLAEEKGLQIDSIFVDECHLCYEMRRILCNEFPQYLAHRGCYQAISE
jgi:MoaA/NifB/PqqE/SkfB family radical SAM enzyme